MRRWHQEEHIARRNWKNHRKIHTDSNKTWMSVKRIGVSAYVVDCECDNQIGRFRKIDAYDCGRTRCMGCHSEKVLKVKRRIEQRADLDFREQLRDWR